jgi:(S)-2-hydroxyglutarate dehydrogenase
MVERFNVAVIGAGIVGLASARAILARRPEFSIAVLEKEVGIAAHQTGHNSGVVHSGVYYRPGSLKAELCLSGRKALLEYAAERGIRTDRIGKFIVASRPEELPALGMIEGRARANRVAEVHRIDAAELRARAPGIDGVAALDIPTAAIIDYPAVARSLAKDLDGHGGVRTMSGVLSATPRNEGWTLTTPTGEVSANYVVNCAGLECDLVAAMMGVEPPVAIVPFRGDYYRLTEPTRSKIRSLIYPLPDPEMPFLGVHLTPMIDGTVLAGPNAAIAFAREGYRPGTLDPRELARIAAFPGTVGMLRRYGGIAAREWLRSWEPAEFLSAVQRLLPSARRSDLGERTSGVRAQAVRSDGSMEDDFVLVHGNSALHVLNAPSPAATASLAIGERVADEAGFRAPA